jgi:hypothetical protein
VFAPACFPVERFPANSCTDTDLSIHSLGEQRPTPGFLFARSECSSRTKEIDRSKLTRRVSLRAINMERGECVQDTLPTMYGIIIAFLTCLVGYALWVSVARSVICVYSILLDPSCDWNRGLFGHFSREARELRLTKAPGTLGVCSLMLTAEGEKQREREPTSRAYLFEPFSRKERVALISGALISPGQSSDKAPNNRSLFPERSLPFSERSLMCARHRLGAIGNRRSVCCCSHVWWRFRAHRDIAGIVGVIATRRL